MRSREVEIKLAVDDVRSVRRQLRRLGFRVRAARHFEENLLFDTARGDLKRLGMMLRLRVANGRARLTLKGAARSSRYYKIRPEAEAPVASAGATRAILGGLGFHPAFRYKKYRTAFGRKREAGEVVLDETPIGNFLELEGSPRWIRRVARALGHRPDDFLTATYADLYRAWRRRHGGPKLAMVFRGKR